MYSVRSKVDRSAIDRSSPPPKYVPRFKRDPNAVPNAVPSFKLYTQHEIAEALPGEGNHTFTRAYAPVVDPSADRSASSDIITDGDDGTTTVATPPRPLADTFARIMVHANAHIAPPKELWTRYNIAQLAANAGRPLPLFQESAAGRHKFGYVGWYRIVRWNVCKGGSAEVRAFVAKRRVSQADMPREYWAGVLGQDWARVQLDKVDDPAFGNPMVQKTAASSQ